MGISVRDFSFLEMRGDVASFLELRMENDSNGNPVYIGYTQYPNGSTAAPIWFIVKITYDSNQSPLRQILPINGRLFTYIWDNRATYF